MPDFRPSWTDERLDDLSKRVDDGFGRVDDRFRQVDARFDRLEARMDAQLTEVNARLDSLQRIMIQFGGMTTLGIITTIATVVLTRA
jgi:hypothetical protein